jgi:hypothetical protein
VGFLFHSAALSLPFVSRSEQDPITLGSTKGDDLFLEGSRLGFPVPEDEIIDDDDGDDGEIGDDDEDDDKGEEEADGLGGQPMALGDNGDNGDPMVVGDNPPDESRAMLLG